MREIQRETSGEIMAEALEVRPSLQSPVTLLLMHMLYHAGQICHLLALTESNGAGQHFRVAFCYQGPSRHRV